MIFPGAELESGAPSTTRITPTTTHTTRARPRCTTQPASPAIDRGVAIVLMGPPVRSYIVILRTQAGTVYSTVEALRRECVPGIWTTVRLGAAGGNPNGSRS